VFVSTYRYYRWPGYKSLEPFGYKVNALPTELTQWAKSPKKNSPKYSVMLSKIHSYRLLFGDFAGTATILSGCQISIFFVLSSKTPLIEFIRS